MRCCSQLGCFHPWSRDCRNWSRRPVSRSLGHSRIDCETGEKTLLPGTRTQCLWDSGMSGSSFRRDSDGERHLAMVLLDVWSSSALPYDVMSTDKSSNLPIGGASFVLILTILKLQERFAGSKDSVVSRLKSLDMLGMILIMASVCCLILALHWGSSSLPWGSSRVVGLLVGAGLLLAAFLFSQWKLQDLATVPLRVLLQRSIMMGALFSFFLEMSIYVVSGWLCP